MCLCRFRRICHMIVNHVYFTNVVLVLILVSSALLAAEDPLDLDKRRNLVTTPPCFICTSVIVQHLIRILQSDWLRARYAQLRNFGVCTLQACDIHPGCCTLASDITMNITKKTFGTRTLEPMTQKIVLRINAYAVASNVTSQKNTAYSV